jgi:PAS domain S-box-containing protein
MAIKPTYEELKPKVRGKAKAKGRAKKSLRPPYKREIDFTSRPIPSDPVDFPKRMIFPVTVHDISKIIKMEAKLKESEEKCRLLLENSNDAVFIVQDGVIKFPNPQAEKMTGYTAAELVGMSFIDIMHPQDCDTVLDCQNRGLTGEKLTDIRAFRIINKSGKELWVKLNIVSMDWEGRPGTLNFITDITHQKTLETRLQQSQKMESIGTLAGGIAHDFNNILFPIIGYTEMLLMDAPVGSENRDSLEEIFKEAMRASDLVRLILTFSRQSLQELKPIRVPPILKEALKLLRSSIPVTIEFHQKIDDNCGIIMGDPTQIHQVIMNLCTNAYHAMQEEGGDLEVELKEIELEVDDEIEGSDIKPGPYIRLTVSDTGHGMDNEVLERIFEPYYTTKEEGKGTGLGLSVVHGIIKAHNGDIRVYSEPGKGTVFHIYLPLIKPHAKEIGSALQETVQRGSERVLLVDDEEPIVCIEKQMLERLGYQVTSRTSSAEALELFRTQPDRFDLVITDMTMPNMTGDKLANELINIRPDIPVILCTGFSERISRDQVATMGIKGFLMKPIVNRDLAKTIREVLEDTDRVHA